MNRRKKKHPCTLISEGHPGLAETSSRTGGPYLSCGALDLKSAQAAQLSARLSGLATDHTQTGHSHPRPTRGALGHETEEGCTVAVRRETAPRVQVDIPQLDHQLEGAGNTARAGFFSLH